MRLFRLNRQINVYFFLLTYLHLIIQLDQSKAKTRMKHIKKCWLISIIMTKPKLVHESVKNGVII